MRVPFQDLPLQTSSLRADLDAAIGRVLQHCQFIHGPECSEFEERFASYVGAKHAVGVASGTDALQLACRALGVGPGDEVITVANTFIATAEAISYAGAKPVLVDCRLEDYLIDPEAVSAAITPRTRAVIAVHLYGQPANFDMLNGICQKHGIHLIEDSAQAHGACLRDGRKCGALGIASGFSFYPGKNLGAFGDAGAVTTGDAEIAGKIRLLRNWGSIQKYRHEVPGYNSRLDTLQAAVLLVKMTRLTAWLDQRRGVANWYRENLNGCSGLVLPLESPWCGRHAYHLFVVRITNLPRDQVAVKLKAAGIQTIVHYPIPIHLQPAYSDLNYRAGAFPNAETAAETILSLPLYPEMTRSQCDYVCEHLRAALGPC